MPIALSRTCGLHEDFPGVVTVAAWQQALADEAWRRWREVRHTQTRTESLVMNWSGVAFTAPGPTATYRYPGAKDNGLSAGLPAVWALSVLEAHEAPVQFLAQATALLRPGGLLFLTFAYWDAEGPDCASGCEDRLRIYERKTLTKLIGEARRLELDVFGTVDWEYHGDRLIDHSLGSLVLLRR